MFTDIYSPLQQLKHPSRYQVQVKRDDLIDPYISGNKWRKLKYILQKVQEESKSHIVTFGGAYSSHLVATAAACCRAGLKSTAFVRGEQVDNEMLALCKLFGMKLIFTDRTSYKDKNSLFSIHYGDDPDAFFVYEGGACTEAVEGCAEIIRELPNDIDHIFCAAGTGTTAAGLLKGIHQRGLKTQLHVIPVLKGGDFIADEIAGYTGKSDQLTLHTDYHFGGYAKTQPELIHFMKSFIAQEGILIDPVYTSKMFFAIDDLLGKGYFKANEKILAIHTGGLLGIMGMKDKF
ncbi:1-aminocyclopropane-1-carboxylate deaminase/D-cysteine desulfhydrase [Pedobacter frigoris]|uniref:1-aminocyclopropane-1-carboxylate deaminase/D-cysteine desulfhydrase n=1 Tax=Pedobacter frigoris TaxID=2571272 RepID=UPI00292CF8AA|nr:pyridoxal-phosphate dependent enzyme [Pedobacter frigoris]